MIRWILALPFRLLFSVLRLVSAPERRRSSNAADAADSYIREVERAHGTRHVPLLACSYAKAVEKAKKDLRLLVVVLTSETHDDTGGMHELLCDETLRGYIIDNGILVWAGNVAELEAYRVSAALGATRYPYIGVVVYNTLRESTTSCVSKIEGLPNSIDLMTHLQSMLDKYGPTLVALKADRSEQTFSREIRAEQDSAYEASLRKDRERAEAQRKERMAKEEHERQALLQETNKLAWRQWQARKLSPEPTATKEVSRISFRMPDGSRCVRKFEATSTIGDVYSWVDLQLNPVQQESESAPKPPLPSYKHVYDFTLAVPMPRQVLEAESLVLSQVKAVYPSGSLIVEMSD